METQKRIAWIDTAKGICMLSVIAGHMGWEKVNTVVYAYHLTVFFLLSGYTLKIGISWEKIGKRFRSLMVPYIYTCVAVTIMDIVNLVVVEKRFDVSLFAQTAYRDLLRSLFASGDITRFGRLDLGGRIGAIWYLPATLAAIVLTLVLLEYIRNRKLRWLCAFGISALAFVSASYFWLPFSVQSGCFALPLVLAGYEAREHGRMGKIKLPGFACCLVVFAVGIATGKTGIFYVTASMDSFLLSPVFGLAASICVIFLSQKMEKCRVLAWIGKNSLYFLCAHLFEMETMGAWFFKIQEMLGMQYNSIVLFCLKLMFITLVVVTVKWCQTIQKKEVACKH